MLTRENDQEEQGANLACNWQAIPVEQRAEHLTTINRVFAAVQEVQDLPDGHAYRLAEELITLQEIASYITYERLCCSFLHFTLSVEPAGAAVWLRLTGQEGVKAMLQTTSPVSALPGKDS